MGSLFRLTTSTLAPCAGTRVLKASDAAALVEANELLATAKARAAAIVQEAEQVYEQRQREGYADGREEGRMEHAEKLMETVLSSVEFIEGIEATLVDVVNQAIRKVIGELDDNERVVRIVRHALLTVRNQQRVIVRVAPADEQAVSEALAALLQRPSGSTSFLELVPDARLERGSCLLESELGVVDASLETQLKALENAFRAKIKS